MMYNAVAEVREQEAQSERDWNFLRDLTGESFFHQRQYNLAL